MCWSFEASAALTVAGTAGVGYGVYTKQPKELVLTLGYFTLMEAIQTLAYPVIDSCALPRNQFLTVLAFMHIAFQPFFINMVMMYFIPKERRKKIAMYVYSLCGVAAAVTLVQLYPFSWAGSCIESVPLCGSPLCSISGDWHLAWNIPLNGLVNFLQPMPFMGLPGYFLIGLLLPFLYGSWRANLYHIVLGPLLAWMLTNNINEAGAVWCTFSIALLLSILGERPLRRYLRVQ
jgi:hypothetical protein